MRMRFGGDFSRRYGLDVSQNRLHSSKSFCAFSGVTSGEASVKRASGRNANRPPFPCHSSPG